VTRRVILLLVLLGGLLLLLPLWANRYTLSLATLFLFFAYVGQTWNIMMGFAGLLSLGHALYLGVGAYAAAALYYHFNIGPWLGLWVALALGALLAAAIGALAFRYKVSGVYFALLTIAFAEFASSASIILLGLAVRAGFSSRSSNTGASTCSICAGRRQCSIM